MYSSRSASDFSSLSTMDFLLLSYFRALVKLYSHIIHVLEYCTKTYAGEALRLGSSLCVRPFFTWELSSSSISNWRAACLPLFLLSLVFLVSVSEFWATLWEDVFVTAVVFEFELTTTADWTTCWEFVMFSWMQWWCWRLEAGEFVAAMKSC